MSQLRKLPLGILLLTALFSFGAVICTLTVVTLLFPGTILEPMWQLKPEAHEQFLSMGGWAIVLMAAVGFACGLAGYGLVVRARWGYWLALGLITTNLASDLADAALRADFRTLIGLPIGGAMIAYLLSRPVRRWFMADSG